MQGALDKLFADRLNMLSLDPILGLKVGRGEN